MIPASSLIYRRVTKVFVLNCSTYLSRRINLLLSYCNISTSVQFIVYWPDNIDGLKKCFTVIMNFNRILASRIAYACNLGS